MRLESLLIVLVLGSGSVVAASDVGPDQGDLSKIQGCWEATVGKKQNLSVSIEVKGNEVAATITPKRGPKVKATGELQLDPSASPRSLDWVKFATADGIEVPRLLSIYRLEGDRLILRSGGFNDARPRSFDPGGEGIWTDVMVFTRPVPTEKTASIGPGR